MADQDKKYQIRYTVRGEAIVLKTVIVSEEEVDQYMNDPNIVILSYKEW